MNNQQYGAEQLFITFQSDDDIQRFVNTCRKYDDAIDVSVDKWTTDAKSILGMLLMKLGHPIAIEYGCYDEENNYLEFKEDIMKNFNITVASADKPKGLNNS